MNPIYTRPCKQCKQQIDTRLKICPFCGKKQKVSGGIIALCIIGGVLFLFILLCILASNTDATQPTQSNTNSRPVTSSQSSAIPKNNNIGDTVTIAEWELTLNSVDVKNAIADDLGGEYKPEDGNKYIVANLTVKNVGKSSEMFLTWLPVSSDIKARIIYDKTYELEPADLFAVKDALNNTEMNPLSSKTGIIIFEVSEDVADNLQKAKLVFYNNKSSTDYNLK